MAEIALLRTENALSGAGINIKSQHDTIFNILFQTFQSYGQVNEEKAAIMDVALEEARGRAEEARRRAEDAKKNADEKVAIMYRILEEARGMAEDARRRAEDARRRAEDATKNADEKVAIMYCNLEDAKKSADEIKALKEKDVIRGESVLVTQLAKYEAMCMMRPIIENAILNIPDLKERFMTNKINEFIKTNIFESENKLKNHVVEWIEQLEGSDPTKVRSIKADFKDLYHELCKQVYFPSREVHLIGYVCGGPFPLRTAVAVVLLALQKGKHLRSKIIYTDEQYTPKKRLQEGGVFEYTKY